MKALFRFFITLFLSVKARRVLKAHNSTVIAVTGSIGKTSTKEAIYTILKNHFNVHRSAQGFNTELGLSLSILQEEESGFSSPLAWIKILRRVFFKKKPSYRTIILEMGADHSGDIKRLIKIAPPKISVITNVALVHLEKGQFEDINAIAEEKSTLIKHLSASDIAIVNIDDPLIREMKTKAQRVTFGTHESAILRAKNIHASSQHLRFTVTYQDQSESFIVPVLGKFLLSVLLPAIAVGLQVGLTLKQCAKALEAFTTPPGRMNPIAGINKSMIIDSSYNASPVTMENALNLLQELHAPRKIAVLGTMNELGAMSKEAHLSLGEQVSKIADILVAVGPEATIIKQGALNAGMDENDVYTFLDSEEAAYFLKDKIQSKDLILVKGSQNRVRMERLVKIIMAQPEKASELLCRQEKAWEFI